jgi:hypothetical protein
MYTILLYTCNNILQSVLIFLFFFNKYFLHQLPFMPHVMLLESVMEHSLQSADI